MEKVRSGLICAVVAGTGLVWAGDGYQVDLLTMAAGGGEIAGGPYSAIVSVGQPDATDQASSGGLWSVEGGLWPAQLAGPDLIFAAGFEN